MRILFTIEANSALDDIIKNFGLKESPDSVVIDQLAKNFVLQNNILKMYFQLIFSFHVC